MVHIEKLQSHLDKPHLTLVDLLHKDNTDSANYLGIYPATHLLKPYINTKLDNIAIGETYGYRGISINELLAENKNIIVETTYQDLLGLPKVKQVRLLTNYTVILSDLEEGGSFFGHMGPCLLGHIRKLGIVPKKIYSLNAGLYQHDCPELNIQSIYICCWAAFPVLAESYYTNLLFNEEAKQEAQKKIASNNKTFGLYLNKKPRYNRVKCLAELDKRGILDKFDWTLLYSAEPLGNENDYGNFIKSPNNFRFNKQLNLYGDEHMNVFLQKYKFPRLMSDSKQSTYGDCLGPAPSWLGKYKYYISNETYTTCIPTSLGTTGFLTEKTFKAMCIGAYPFVIGTPGSEKKLSSLGFQLLPQDYDSLAGGERVSAVCEIIELATKSNYDVTEIVMHNFNLITNLDFLAGLIASPVNQMFQPS